MKKNVIFILLLTILSSCKSEYEEYSGTDAIYLNEISDTVRFSFTYVDSEYETQAQDIHLKVIGKVADYDRPVNIKFTPVNAVEEKIDAIGTVTLSSKEAIEAVKEARAHGDLSENFEYHAAKKDKNRNESRIRYLERMLKTAKIVKDTSAADEAGLNNLVEVYFPEDDETDTFKLVTSIRGNSLDGKISIESPLGKAILKKHVGDRVKVHVNDDYSYEVEIRSIQKTTDDTDDKIRSY